MKRFKLFVPILVLVACSASMVRTCSAQGQPPQAGASDTQNDQDWYYTGKTVTEKKTISQQKAEARAKQRMSRLEAHRWLGYSPSRPPSTVIPFTSSNSLDWKKTHRHRRVWYTGRRPFTYHGLYY